MPVSSLVPPSVGQVVDVRNRRYIVQKVRASQLAPAHELMPRHLTAFLAQSLSQARSYHIVSLSSVEDDAWGDEREVIWEVEIGARAFDQVALPTPARGFDTPRQFAAFMDAVRWGSVSSADLDALQSPFRSGIEVQDYQLDPVARALQMPRVNLLIADDVGLGKTIEAGLVVQELLLRGRARRVLVVCPAGIQLQWRDEMLEKFGLEFRVVDAELMRKLRRRRGLDVNPWTHFPRLITSMDYLKRERPLRLFRETLPAAGEAAFPRRHDLLIVDEAHNIAPPGGTHYAIDSQRTAAVREIAPHFEHKLFLSATPHNGYAESFSALLELLDNQRFARAIAPDREQLAAAMVRRLKSEIKNWDGSAMFPQRVLDAIEVDYPQPERDAHRELNRYTQLRRQNASNDAEKLATEFVLKLLKKRLFSSPQAFLDTLLKHRATLNGQVENRAPRRERNLLQRQIEETESGVFDDGAYEESLQSVNVEASRLFLAPSVEEDRVLDVLQSFASQASDRGDAKSAALLSWLARTLKPDGAWNSERVIIFTEYRATQKWLQGLLSAAGLGERGRLETIYGGMDSDERERIKAAFQAAPDDAPVRLLLSTDAASEGVNLQNHCSRLVHYEIPWNPNRMEQRNGRINRHGQRAKSVQIFHFVGKGFADERNSSRVVWREPGDLEGDLEFLLRAARKVETIREDLGKVGPVIALQVEEAMLGRRQKLDTTRAENEAQPARRMLKYERDLRKQLRHLHEQLSESRRVLQLSPDNVRRAVDVALQLADQPPLLPHKVHALEHRVLDIADETPKRDATIEAWHLPHLGGSWSEAALGLEHPHTRKIRPIVFDENAARGRDDVVFAHLNHRLVAMCLRLLRAEMWAGRDPKMARVTCALVNDAALDAPAIFAHGRLLVLGGDQTRLHEELIVAGGLFRDGRFERLGVNETNRVLEAATDEMPNDAAQTRLASLWDKIEKPLMTSLEARMRERTAGLAKLLEARSMKESADIRAILGELERAIRGELGADEPQQLELWSEAERDQLRRNHESLRSRLERIPAELARETQAIEHRYAAPSPQLFPVAVTFLLPRRLAR